MKEAWNLTSMLDKVSWGLNPLKPINDDGDYEELQDEDKEKVLDKIIEAYENSSVEWLLTVLEMLLAPGNDIINQESTTLEFNKCKCAETNHETRNPTMPSLQTGKADTRIPDSQRPTLQNLPHMRTNPRLPKKQRAKK